jgi:4-carboxymuconolactone decarboxylase
MSKMPKRYETFVAKYPEIGAAYETMGEAVRAAGPLDAKTCALIKLGISLGAGSEGGMHSQVRKAIDAGATPEELRHAVLQATTTLGFATMMRGMSWLEDVIGAS